MEKKGFRAIEGVIRIAILVYGMRGKNPYSCCKVPFYQPMLVRFDGMGPTSWLFERDLLHKATIKIHKLVINK